MVDEMVRNVDANRTSAVRQGNGRRAHLEFMLVTGDQADNQQLNETQRTIRILDGGRVDPFSGRRIGPGNPCSSATPQEVARLNSDVAQRRYTGVQDYSEYPGLPSARYAGFWDPDRPAPSGPYAAFPRYPGLLARALRPFTAKGLEVPGSWRGATTMAWCRATPPPTSPFTARSPPAA